jgi:hypothetical protein
MMDPMNGIRAQGGGYGPPPGGYGPPGGMPPGGMPGGYGGPPAGMPGGPPPGAPMGPPGGAPMGPPGGMPGGMGGPPDLQAHVNKWFNLSILSIFCGCGLLGLINVYMAHLAKEALKQGDVATATDKIKLARTLCIVGYVIFGLYVLGAIAYVIFAFVVVGAAAAGA